MEKLTKFIEYTKFAIVSIMFIGFFKEYVLSISKIYTINITDQIKETNAMNPSINPHSKKEDRVSLFNRDYVIILKIPSHLRMIRGNSLVAMKSPYEKEIIIRYAVGESGD